MKTNYDYIIYTDGAYSMKNDEGAFAFVVLNGNMEEIMRRSFKIKHETNNRAELKAIIGALHQITTWSRKVLVVSDSQYSIKTLSGEWGRKANEDLFEVYDRLIEDRKMHVDYKWVKGHSGDEYNEICDGMCVKALGYDPKEEYEKYKKEKGEEEDMVTITKEEYDYLIRCKEFIESNNWTLTNL